MNRPKRFRSWRVLRERRRNQYWRAGVVGLGAGAVALAFEKCLTLAEGARSALLVYLHTAGPLWGWMVLPVIGGLIGAFVGLITARFAPEASGSGIPNVKGVLMHVSSLSWKRVLPVKFVGGVLCIGSGFSLGREGPTVQMGAAIGKLFAEILRVPAKATPRLMACGAGAGLAAAFHAPLAGFIFTIEELQREFSSLTYTMALIAAVAADIVTTTFWGSENVFHSTGFPAVSLKALPVCILVGLLAGVLGSGFNRSLLWGQRLCHDRLKYPAWVRASLVGVVVGLVAWWLPEVTGGGHRIAEQILHGGPVVSLSVELLTVMFLGKFVLTVLSYSSGVPGGIFAPMLVMGASLGLVSGNLSSRLMPGIVPIPESFAAIGMAAFFAAVVRAPLTGIVLVLEMTGDYRQLLPLIIASMFAFVVSERLRIEPIYDALLAADLQRKQPDIPVHREPVLLEFVVQDESEMDGKAIREIPLPERCLFVTITRNGNDLLPNGDTVIRRGDHVTAVLSGANTAESVSRLLPLSKA